MEKGFLLLRIAITIIAVFLLTISYFNIISASTVYRIVIPMCILYIVFVPTGKKK